MRTNRQHGQERLGAYMGRHALLVALRAVGQACKTPSRLALLGLYWGRSTVMAPNCNLRQPETRNNDAPATQTRIRGVRLRRDTHTRRNQCAYYGGLRRNRDCASRPGHRALPRGRTGTRGATSTTTRPASRRQ